MALPVENNILPPAQEQTPPSISQQGSEGSADEDKKIIALVDETFARYRKRRQGFERDWFRNCIFKLGNQWIRWDKDTQQFRKKKLASWVPTPVTNIFNSTGERLVSVLSRIEPNWVFVPASDQEQDIASAEVGEQVAPIICEENEIEKLRAGVSRWLTWTGNVFLYPGAEEIQDLKMLQMKNQLKKEMPESSDMIDEMMEGQMPEGLQQPTAYKLYTDVLSPFEVYADMTIQDIDNQEKVLLVNPRDKEWVKRTYGQDVEEERGEGLSLRYLETLGYVSSEFGAFGDQGSASGIGSDNTIPRCLVKRFFQRPNEEYPDGLYAVVAGGKLLEKGALPKSLDGKPYIPIVQFKFDEVPGAFFGMSTMNDIIPKQVMINQLDSLIMLMTTRMSSPIWVITNGTKVNSWNIGEPGSVLEANLIGDRAVPPTRIPGEQIPSTLITWRQELKKDIEELSACLTAETVVPCLDGKDRTMFELSKEFPDGGMWVYGFNTEQMRVVPSEIKSAWYSGKKESVRVSFKEGTSVECSFDHPFLTYGRGYVKACDLKEDESIVPLVFYEGKYLSIVQPIDRKAELVSRMVCYSLKGLGRGIDKKLDVHHKKERHNNLPENLEVLTRREHLKITPRNCAWVKSEEGRKTISKTSKKAWEERSEEERRRITNYMVNVKRTPQERERQSERMKNYNSSLTKEQRQQKAINMNAKIETPWQTTLEGRARLSQTARAKYESMSPEEKQKKMDHMRSCRKPMNHRVLKVESIGIREVYDLQTSTGNFGLGAGVFVHNTFDALKGKSPYSGAPAELVNMLIEQGMSRFGPAFRNIADGWRHWMKYQLELFRQYATTPRPLPTQLDNGEWKFKQFSQADFKGAVNVRIESDSYIPRSESAESAKVVTAATANIIDMSEEDNRANVLRELHLEKFIPNTEDDIHSAELENQLFTQMPPTQPGTQPQTLPVNEFIDNHPIHIKRHKRFANTDNGRQFLQAINQHIAQHDMIMQAMMNPGMMGPPPGMPVNGKPELNPKQAQTLAPQKNAPSPGGPPS